MRRAEDAHVDRLFGHRADRAHRALLDRAQQLRLHRQRQVADLVEEQRAAVGGLKEALAIVVGTGERALSIAEEFGLEQLLGIALQLTGTNGSAPRALTSWIARATSSLPVPDSPVTSTGAMLRATFSTSERTCCIAADWPAMRPSAALAAPAARPAPARGGARGAVARCSEGRLAGSTVGAPRRRVRAPRRRRRGTASGRPAW